MQKNSQDIQKEKEISELDGQVENGQISTIFGQNQIRRK